MALRIQRRRTKGWRAPAGSVYVGRPTKWGNPHRVSATRPAATAVARYRADLVAGRLAFTPADVRRELGGKDLVCWCPPGAPCHADVLVDFANRGY